MAANTSLLFFFFASLLSFNVSTTFSRDLPESKPNTVVLDVSSSLELAQAILSFDPQTQKPFDEQLASSLPPANFTSSFSLHLHPRESLVSSNHREYRSLVLSRLARDSDRVNSLNAKLELILGNVRKSDLRPVEIEIQAEDFSAPIIYDSSGEYFTRIGVGTPAKQYYMTIDTGSDVNWLQCEPCSHCYRQTDPIFQPGSSSSYSALTCESSQCAALSTSFFACQNSKCLYKVSYGDKSNTVGDFATETVSLGNSGSINGFALGCGHNNVGLFVASAGLIGLGGGPLSLTSQTNSSSFSYCLVNSDSRTSSTLDFNSAPPSDSIAAPLVRNGKSATFYYIQVVGMSVGGEAISVSPDLFQVDGSGNGGIIVDSGTTVTLLRTPIYESLREAFKKRTPSLRPASGPKPFDTCYNFSSLSTVEVPTVSFLFAGGKSWALPARNYLTPVDSSGTFCFAFAPTTVSLSIIGNIQQQGTRVSFDLANSLVGFSPG